MGIYIVLCVVTALLTLALFYALFKLIWYAREMLLLSRSLKAAERAGAVVARKRGLFAPLFKQKGEVDFTVDTNGRQYAVSVLSFISTRGRWNFEKGKDGYLLECRRRPFFFYKKKNNSGAPLHALEYARETHFARRALYISSKANDAKEIFLLYPWPRTVSETSAQYRELFPKDTVAGHTLMDARTFFETVFEKDTTEE